MISSLGQPLDGLGGNLAGQPVERVLQDGRDSESLDGSVLDGATFASSFGFSAQPPQGNGPRASGGPRDGSAQHGGQDALRVLLVDDHADMLALMRMMLERRSYHVETAFSGEQALQLAPEFCPHIVVSDIGMPGMDGYELMLALRAQGTLAPFKSIALSGYDAHEEGARARAAGYDAQFTKPVDFEQLFQAIDSLATHTA